MGSTFGAQSALEFKSRFSTQRGCGKTLSPNQSSHGTEEIILPENLLPLGSMLGQGVTPLDVSMVLAKVFRVRYTEVALLRLEDGLLRFIFPEHLRTTGAIPISGKAIAAHTALSKKAEIFNNFAKVKHASIFETIKPSGVDKSNLVRTRFRNSCRFPSWIAIRMYWA